MKHSSSFTFAVAALFASGCGGPSAAEDASMKAAGQVKCLGGNACNGQSQCAVPGEHMCGGHDDCKAKGWVAATPPACDKLGGTELKT